MLIDASLIHHCLWWEPTTRADGVSAQRLRQFVSGHDVPSHDIRPTLLSSLRFALALASRLLSQ
jgi:hypothetical protein